MHTGDTELIRNRISYWSTMGGPISTVVTPSPTEVKGMSSGAAFADFDNDGYLDLVTSHIANTSEDNNFGRSNGLYRNDGKGGMIDVSGQKQSDLQH